MIARRIALVLLLAVPMLFYALGGLIVMILQSDEAAQ